MVFWEWGIGMELGKTWVRGFGGKWLGKVR